MKERTMHLTSFVLLVAPLLLENIDFQDLKTESPKRQLLKGVNYMYLFQMY